ncbi:MAG: helix-turn-helix domain-containing protein [Oscillibacter sp.]|nr:helix-turn-helix domain-containing protein [Oscillibacter sp.]MBQ7681209.1 helix-turn-helix domain-containing protein [Oscillibacter sp.]MBQ9618584.1 helix-turn-helix domain-containing protein [Oscillibacter sp.]
MSIVYKINVLAALKKAGYNTYKIQQEKLFSQATLQALREGRMISLRSLNRICYLLKCQPGDILEYVPDNKQE